LARNVRILLIIRWIKIVKDRLLIFSKKSQNKAILSYNLKECEISGQLLEDKNGKKTKFKKSLSVGNINEISMTCKERHHLIEQFNYKIEIDHPYLQKCSIKCNQLLESLDLYNELSGSGSS
jgi:hypothetical protein